jgi:hypothetical protein
MIEHDKKKQQLPQQPSMSNMDGNGGNGGAPSKEIDLSKEKGPAINRDALQKEIQKEREQSQEHGQSF